MKVPLVAFVLASLAFAGCTGSEAPSGTASGSPETMSPCPEGLCDCGAAAVCELLPEGPPLDFGAGIPPPIWNVGDWWQYQVDFTSGESYNSKIVVYGDDGANYLVTADDRDLILRSAFTHYPTISPVKKDSLNQFIHGVEVAYLQFPMKNGTWTGTYRGVPAAWSASYATLDTPNGDVPGFTTVMRMTGTGQGQSSVLRQGWSPVTKWFTNFTFDFDGADPVDVSVTLQDWGSNFTGALPVLEIIDGVHRLFPAVGLPPVDPENPPNGAPPAPPEPQDSFTIGPDSAMLLGMFAGAGGPGNFEFNIGPIGGQAQPGYTYPWRPTAAGSHFEWHEVTDAQPGEWGVLGGGSAQFFAFLFLESYEVKTTEVTLPAA